MPEGRASTGSEPTETRRTIYECGCVLIGPENRSATDPGCPRQPLTCPVHRAIWADKRPLDREIARIAGTLDGDLHLHHAGGQCEPINPADLVGHVLNQAGLAVEPDHGERAEATRCSCGDGSAEEDRGAVLRCPVHGIGEWQPDERTVKAVVEALREMRDVSGGWFFADCIAERFNLTGGRDDDE